MASRYDTRPCHIAGATPEIFSDINVLLSVASRGDSNPCYRRDGALSRVRYKWLRAPATTDNKPSAPVWPEGFSLPEAEGLSGVAARFRIVAMSPYSSMVCPPGASASGVSTIRSINRRKASIASGRSLGGSVAKFFNWLKLAWKTERAYPANE